MQDWMSEVCCRWLPGTWSPMTLRRRAPKKRQDGKRWVVKLSARARNPHKPAGGQMRCGVPLHVPVCVDTIPVPDRIPIDEAAHLGVVVGRGVRREEREGSSGDEECGKKCLFHDRGPLDRLLCVRFVQLSKLSCVAAIWAHDRTARAGWAVGSPAPAAGTVVGSRTAFRTATVAAARRAVLRGATVVTARRAAAARAVG